MNARQVSTRLLRLSLLFVSVSFASVAPMLGTASEDYWQVAIATKLTSVEKGSFDGRDYLSLNIGGHEVGPSRCRGTTLRMDNNSEAGIARQSAIESIALTAMLEHTTVMIVVPLDSERCIDGKPSFTDLYTLRS